MLFLTGHGMAGVMVESGSRIHAAGEWQRACQEINDMEKILYDAGAVVLKFWMQIDKDDGTQI